MDHISQRTQVAMLYRWVLSRWEKYLIFPIKNPSYYQVAGLVLSVVYLYVSSLVWQSILIGVILLFDWMDGAAARKYKVTGKKGWMIDVCVDRVSEGFIYLSALFSRLGTIFFLLYLCNIMLSLYSVKSGKHILLPLRFAWLLILIYRVWII
ncbi:CDP-alcohol phosphatidyltransferase family protein [Candidatus Gottesmanbacteria bacterium]|nr:CDP-alcohol phosphatidyltransferase family protein [Candidatus Gottesmanbacteria bacterium]